MRLWRLSQWPGLAGEGGLYASGRWNPVGLRVVYASEHPALAMIENFAHLRLKPVRGALPTTLQLIAVDVDEDAEIAAAPSLPANWPAHEPATRAIGGAWLRLAQDLLLPVPSVLVAHATNYLINPAHPQAATHVREAFHEPFRYDARLIR